MFVTYHLSRIKYSLFLYVEEIFNVTNIKRVLFSLPEDITWYLSYGLDKNDLEVSTHNLISVLKSKEYVETVTFLRCLYYHVILAERGMHGSYVPSLNKTKNELSVEMEEYFVHRTIEGNLNFAMACKEDLLEMNNSALKY